MDESNDFNCESPHVAPSTAPPPNTQPRTTTPRLPKSMNPKFFDKESAMGTAWQAQKEQKFGKDNLQGYLDSDDMSNLFTMMPSSRILWNEFK
jgi:hypothetical protein